MSPREESHIPVLRHAINDLVQPFCNRDGLTLLDGTYGRGGHARMIADSLKLSQVILMDLDPLAIKDANMLREQYPQLNCLIHHGLYSEAKTVIQKNNLPEVDLLLLDLGVSSPQIDDPKRGFSFLKPGPLDMRMNTKSGRTAAEYIRELGEENLAGILFQYGEEPFSRRIARAICERNRTSPINDTATLADIIERVVPGRGKNHPATRSFQALRIALNGELDALETLLEDLPTILAPGGRAMIISFHSLEDRLVKKAFQKFVKNDQGRLINKKGLTATQDEIKENRRARSARLRCFERRSN